MTSERKVIWFGAHARVEAEDGIGWIAHAVSNEIGGQIGLRARREFTDDEFARVLSWAYEGLLTTPTDNPADRELFERLGQMLTGSD